MCDADFNIGIAGAGCRPMAMLAAVTCSVLFAVLALAGLVGVMWGNMPLRNIG